MPPKAAKKAHAHREMCFIQTGDAAMPIDWGLAPGILPDGCIALVKFTKELKHGDLAAVSQPDKTLMLYRVYDVAGERVFVSISLAETADGSVFAPVFADNTPFEIVGKVVGIQFEE